MFSWTNEDSRVSVHVSTFFHSICDFRKYAEYDIIELVYTVPVPVSMIKHSYSYCPYKYCVLSKPVEDFMVSPFEFIAGHDWSRTAKIINRMLKLPDSPPYITKESK